VIACVVVTLGALLASRAGPAPSLIDSPAPELSGVDLDGVNRDLRDYRGQIVLVNIWASWCAPCKEEIPVLVRAQEEYADDGVIVLGIATQDRAGNARQAATDWGADAYVSIVDEDGKLAVAWGSRGVPETYVVDRNGVVVHRHFGPVTDEWLAEHVEPVASP
jgi:cytochrome c biogenesis protein CcmG/thiol:disulfide interchange protein DsbE